MLFKIDPQALLKIASTNVTQNWFHKRYSMQIHKRYSKWVPKGYSKLVPQKLLKIRPQAVPTLLACNFFFNEDIKTAL